MSDNWQQTEQIVMAIQTAEIHHPSIEEQPRLHLSCSLVNIARGQCILDIQTNTSDPAKRVGSLFIEINRPVMQGELRIPKALFDSLVLRLANAPPRPISLNLTIASKLAVSLKGDLRIDAATNVEVTDISVNIPLK